MLYLLSNQDGKRKVDFRKDLSIYPLGQISALNLLLQNNLVIGGDKDKNNLFYLTENGKEIAILLKNIKNKMKKSH